MQGKERDLDDTPVRDDAHTRNRKDLGIGTTSRAGPKVNNRLPHISFASKVEVEILKLWRKPQSELFRNPVPSEVQGYYTDIKQPICLRDMLEKICE